jgi:undecaprenyl phosphate N,N'-diacetylbacillosamine 1-phosphate transferase
MRRINLCLKRITDIIGSLVGLVFLSPVFLVIALLIKMDSLGPVFFVQDRLGLRGRTFRIIKFRTMVVNAENIGDGLRVKSERDPRITKVGRILRATSLDELPQLINVLKGDMSLVGPRPPATYHPYDGYAKYPEWAKKRFEMRPGITGLAQVRLRNSAPWTERIEMDVKYVEQYHIAKDFWILFWTIRRVFTKENIYA